MSPDIDTSMSLASIPGNSAEILYTFSSSLMSIAGAAKLNELAGRHAGSTSNMRRSEGKPKPLLNRSNRRSISLRKECHTSGTFVCAIQFLSFIYGGRPMLETYHGRCHCGRVRFRIRADLGTIGECNCSICTKKGILHLPVTLDRFELLCGEGELTTYRFNTGTAQ